MSSLNCFSTLESLIFFPKGTHVGGPPAPATFLALVNWASFLAVSHFSARNSTRPPTTSSCPVCSCRKPFLKGMSAPGLRRTLVPGADVNAIFSIFESSTAWQFAWPSVSVILSILGAAWLSSLLLGAATFLIFITWSTCPRVPVERTPESEAAATRSARNASPKSLMSLLMTSARISLAEEGPL